jgi:hypothetical protein
MDPEAHVPVHLQPMHRQPAQLTRDDLIQVGGRFKAF